VKELLEKIDIDHSKSIRKFEDGTWELHIQMTGPTGAMVYFFDEYGRLIGKQRRSYMGYSKLYEAKFQ
tara:strand:+ start:139 stop:342 length:204 start_codon:yes stop_codon:yes gene_type:complete